MSSTFTTRPVARPEATIDTPVSAGDVKKLLLEIAYAMHATRPVRPARKGGRRRAVPASV